MRRMCAGASSRGDLSIGGLAHVALVVVVRVAPVDDDDEQDEHEDVLELRDGDVDGEQDGAELLGRLPGEVRVRLLHAALHVLARAHRTCPDEEEILRS